MAPKVSALIKYVVRCNQRSSACTTCVSLVRVLTVCHASNCLLLKNTAKFWFNHISASTVSQSGDVCEANPAQFELPLMESYSCSTLSKINTAEESLFYEVEL